MPAKPLTPEQSEDAARLASLFSEAKKTRADLTQESLAHECGWKTQGTVFQYLNGKIPLNLNALLKFSKALGVTPELISPALAHQISELSQSIELSPANNTKASAIRSPSNPLTELVEIPQFEAGGSMGGGLILRDQPGIIESWRVSPEWIEKNVGHHTGAANLAIVTGFGPSMRPLFNPGDPLLVDRGVTKADVDGVYFFRVGDEGFIKHLQRIPGQGLVAISENKTYRDWVITPDMDFEVFARVIKVWRGTEF